MLQVPCDVTPGSSVPVVVNIGGGSSTVNVPIQAASPGIFETPMSDGVRRAVAIRPDGTFVSLENPARRGEVIRIYVTGLGPTSPAITTGSLGVPGIDSLVSGEVIVGLQNSGVRVVSARAANNLIGLYEVSFQVPADAPAGNDLVLSVALNPAERSARRPEGVSLETQGRLRDCSPTGNRTEQDAIHRMALEGSRRCRPASHGREKSKSDQQRTIAGPRKTTEHDDSDADSLDAVGGYARLANRGAHRTCR